MQTSERAALGLACLDQELAGSMAFVVRIFRMDNDALDAVGQLKSTVVAGLQRLCRLAPAAIKRDQ
jgi:hypothetical protein